MANIKISELPVASTVADADVVVINQGGTTKQAARSLVNAPTGTLPVANGGTGVTVSTGASSVVLRDANQNISVNSAIEGFTSVAASGTQITLTVASTPSFLVTGSGGQVIQLPNATTLQNGVVYLFNNNQSSGAITVNNNSGTLVASIPSGGFTAVSLLSNAIAAGSWERHEQAPSNVMWSTNTLDYAGSITSATWNGNAVAVNRGGTGQSTFTDGQLLIGNTTGNTLTKATLTAGTNVTITNAAGAITIAASGGTATPTDVQTFTSSGTWTKPAGAVSIDVVVISAGGGGGSGRKAGVAAQASGGGGGGGGSYSFRNIAASLLGPTEAVAVGSGGTGGASVTVNSTNGNIGVNGGNSSFGAWIQVTGGTGAGAATTASGPAGAGSSSRAMFLGGNGSAGGAGAGVLTSGSNVNVGGAGGGAGGGLPASATVGFTGSTGGTCLGSWFSGGTANGGAIGGNGASAPNVAAGFAASGSAGGGGGSSVIGNAGNGGNGGTYGGAGGGGGAGLDSVGNSGAGGNGADGIVVVTTYF